MNRVVVFSPDAVPAGDVLAAGPGVRYFEIANGLKRAGFSVTLAVPADTISSGQKISSVTAWTVKNIGEIIADADAVILPQVHAALSTEYPKAAPPDLPTAVDLYDPVLIENLGLLDQNDDSLRQYAGYLSGVIPILKRGDFFFCANRRQRLYYLGVLNALGRINPLTYGYKMIDLVPFGVNELPPEHRKKVMRGSLVGEKDPVILWFSGIYPWFDAVTLIKAMPVILKSLPDCKLVILGGKHPRSHAPDDEFRAVYELASRTGLLDRSVIFVDWQPYEERGNWYLEADLAVTTHKQTLETELSHRTRVVDFIWAGLPMIVSRGDEVGSMVESFGCGETVAVGNVEELAGKILKILKDVKIRGQMKTAAGPLANMLRWDKVLEPLIEWAADPVIAPDRKNPVASDTVLKVIGTVEEHREMFGLREEKSGLIKRTKDSLENDGLIATFKKTLNHGTRKIRGDKS